MGIELDVMGHGGRIQRVDSDDVVDPPSTAPVPTIELGEKPLGFIVGHVRDQGHEPDCAPRNREREQNDSGTCRRGAIMHKAESGRARLRARRPDGQSKHLTPLPRPRVDDRIDCGACVSPAPKSREIDSELVSRAQAGDEEALRDLVSRAYPLVHRWALVRTGDPTEADDLTQDVLVQLVKRLDAYGHGARFTTWLYTVTRNAALDRHRRVRRRQQVYENPHARDAARAEPAPDPGVLADRFALVEVVRAFFQDLPPRQREVFDMGDLQGLTSVEIAERLGIEPVSVRAHLFKARRTLRARILERHPELAEEWT
jgi:RNA polymerase sigma-70 factor (ECF subfamily)